MKKTRPAAALVVSSVVAAGGVAAEAAPDILADTGMDEAELHFIPTDLHGEAPDVVAETEDADLIVGTEFAQTIYGGDPDDVLRPRRGDSLCCTVYGGGPGDVLQGGGGLRPSIYGGGGGLKAPSTGGIRRPDPNGGIRLPRRNNN